MIKLQTPELALKNGDLIPWDQAVLHVGCEGVNRGLSVFEGIKGYWREDGAFGLVALCEHYERLLRSARLLQIPCPWTYEEFEADIFKLIGALIDPEEDMWVRATLFVVEGHWGEGTKADLIMTAFRQNPRPPSPISLGVSTWQRSSDNSVSYRIKSTANYQVGRIARIEGRSRNCDDMILLNQWGRVAEATGSAVLVVRSNEVLTPTHTEGALEKPSVACTIKGAMQLGSTVITIRRRRPPPPPRMALPKAW